MHWVSFALTKAPVMEGSASEARIAMIEITTKSSIRVKAANLLRRVLSVFMGVFWNVVLSRISSWCNMDLLGSLVKL